MLERLVLFGATGDLAGRYLFPALGALAAARRLPEGFTVSATARPEWSDERFRAHVAERLAEHASELPPSARDELLRRLTYRHADLDNAEAVAQLVGERACAIYLALPPRLFSRVVDTLMQVRLPPGSRLGLEKPLGESLEGAARLNAQLASFPGGERAIFRIDYVLGMPTVHNLLGLRFANRVLEPLWRAEHIEEIEILWEETIALEGRADFYDRNGALRDVMQNHMMQLLALVAMEQPAALHGEALRRAKTEVLRAVRPPRESEMATRTRRARYAAGRSGDRDVPAYEHEPGVDGSRGTETFAEVVLSIANERWAGTRFVMRAGKALAARRKGLVVHFRGPTRWPLRDAPAVADELFIGIDGPTDIRLQLNGVARNGTAAPVPVVLAGAPPDSELPAYAHVLLDLLAGSNDLSLGGAEEEEAWRIVTPVLAAFEAGAVPLESYPAGSAGPR